MARRLCEVLSIVVFMFGVSGIAFSASIVEHPGSDDVTWDYFTYVPDSASRSSENYIIVVCPGSLYEECDNYNLSKSTAAGSLNSYTQYADRYGYILLSMATPRTFGWYGPMLTRSTVTSDEGWYKRPDFELSRILTQFKSQLISSGYPIANNILLSGYSAGGAFAPRFAFLHPEMVLAVAAGGQGGMIWPIIEDQGRECTYPLGVSDLETFTGFPFDPLKLMEVTFRLYIGEADDNACLGDECWDRDQEDILLNLFGATPPLRVQHLHSTFLSMGIPSQVEIYPGRGHIDTLSVSIQDTFDFFNSITGVTEDK